MSYRIKRVIVSRDYRLHIEFADGVSGEIDLQERLFGPMFKPLRDRKLFNQARIDEFGVICWPNSADLAPEALHWRLRNLKDW